MAFFNKSVVHYDENAPKNIRDDYQDIQRDPYKYLLTPVERASAFAPLPRLIIGYGLGGLWAAYHLRRNNQLHLLFKFKLTGDLVVGVYTRVLIGFFVGDRIGARFFCNYKLLWRHKAADFEIRKMTRQWPDVKPFVPQHDRANSYFWV